MGREDAVGLRVLLDHAVDLGHKGEGDGDLDDAMGRRKGDDPNLAFDGDGLHLAFDGDGPNLAGDDGPGEEGDGPSSPCKEGGVGGGLDDAMGFLVGPVRDGAREGGGGQRGVDDAMGRRLVDSIDGDACAKEGDGPPNDGDGPINPNSSMG